MLEENFKEELRKKKLFIKDNIIEDIFELYKSNDYYEKVSDNYPVKLENVSEDINDIPEFIRPKQKHFFSIYNEENELVAVVDFLDGYSFQNKDNKDALWIGLLKLDKQFQRQGIGSVIIESLESACKKENKKIIQLGVIRKNVVGYNFWLKEGFRVFREGNNKKYDLYLMEKEIGND